MGNQLKTLSLLSRNFGALRKPLQTLALFEARTLLNRLGFALDHLLFPGFRKVSFDRPVFILGNPRSGTTLMHRFLVQLDPLCGFDLWEMLFPSITSRKVLSPMIDFLADRLPAPPHAREIHETGLKYAETDDAYLMFQHLEGPLYWAAVQAWDESFAGEVLENQNTEALEQRCFDALEAVWRRNLYFRKRSRLVVKSSLVSAAIPGLLKRYPDARLLYMMRNPLQVIPSCLSLVEAVYVPMIRSLKTPTAHQMERYYEHLYQAACQLYRNFHTQRHAGLIPDRNLRVVSYRRLMRSFDQEMGEVLDFIGVPSASASGLLGQMAQKQSDRKSGHRYTLEQYGLSEARVRRDLSFIFDHYDVE